LLQCGRDDLVARTRLLGPSKSRTPLASMRARRSRRADRWSAAMSRAWLQRLQCGRDDLVARTANYANADVAHVLESVFECLRDMQRIRAGFLPFLPRRPVGYRSSASASGRRHPTARFGLDDNRGWFGRNVLHAKDLERRYPRVSIGYRP